MSGKLIGKIIAGIVVGIIFTILYLRYSIKTKSAEKLAKKIEKDPEHALKLADSLNVLWTKITADYSIVNEKLSDLKFERDVLNHRIYKCYRTNANSFIIITLYEHLDPSTNTEKLFMLNYKFELSTNNTVNIYTNQITDKNEFGFRENFVRFFFKDYIKIKLDA